MAGYLVAHLEVTDPEAFGRYRDAVGPLIHRFGGRYLIRGGEPETREGSGLFRRVVVVEFPTIEDARAFYDCPEYAPLIALRAASTVSHVALIPGA